MKVLATVGAVALMTFGLAAQTPAQAFSLNPKGAGFSASGPTTLTQGGVTISCTTTVGGSINAAGVGSIAGAAFAGGGFCPLITAANLPWIVTATGLTTATVSGVEVITPLGVCGPSPISGTLIGGVFTFVGQALAGGCVVSGTLATTPIVTITNP